MHDRIQSKPEPCGAFDIERKDPYLQNFEPRLPKYRFGEAGIFDVRTTHPEKLLAAQNQGTW